jgi:hypothetical protein
VCVREQERRRGCVGGNADARRVDATRCHGGRRQGRVAWGAAGGVQSAVAVAGLCRGWAGGASAAALSCPLGLGPVQYVL